MKIITSELLEMSYDELIEYFIKKNGQPKYDYFHTQECRSVHEKNSRTKEGLEIHHIDENKYDNLSGKWAKKFPYECQKANRLVYVNVLEHFLLHIKIYQEDSAKRIDAKKHPEMGKPGIYFLTRRINGYFSIKSFDSWHDNMARIIKRNFSEYILELTYFLTVFSKYYPDRLLAYIYFVALKEDGTYYNRVINHLHKTCVDILPTKVGNKIEHHEYGIGVVTEVNLLTRSCYYFNVMFDGKGLKNVSSNDNFKIIRT